MSKVGYRIYQKINRPDRGLVEQFRGLPSSNISDNMNRLYSVDPQIKQMNGRNVLGTAVTVYVPSGDNLLINYALGIAEPGDVIVIARGNGDVAFLGGLMARKARNRKLAGIVVDGCVRDSDELGEIDIPLYAKGAVSRGPYKNGPGEINVPVSFGNAVVFPGDIIAGDADGLVVIRPDDAPFVLEKAWAQNKKENDLAAVLDSEEPPKSVISDAMKNQILENAEIIDDAWKQN